MPLWNSPSWSRTIPLAEASWPLRHYSNQSCEHLGVRCLGHGDLGTFGATNATTRETSTVKFENLWNLLAGLGVPAASYSPAHFRCATKTWARDTERKTSKSKFAHVKTGGKMAALSDQVEMAALWDRLYLPSYFTSRCEGVQLWVQTWTTQLRLIATWELNTCLCARLLACSNGRYANSCKNAVVFNQTWSWNGHWNRVVFLSRCLLSPAECHPGNSRQCSPSSLHAECSAQKVGSWVTLIDLGRPKA